MRSRHIGLITVVTGLVLATPARAQAPRAGAMVSGTVYDSVARRPLADASVELVDATAIVSSRTQRTRTDSLGQFSIRLEAQGRYLIGFSHPLLDSLSLESPTRTIDVGAEPVRVDLAVPSLETIARVLCPTTAMRDSMATLIGRLYDAEVLSGIQNGSLTLWWRELVVGAAGVTQRQPRVSATTRDGGAFAFCGVPADAEVGLFGARGADSTDVVMLTMANRGVTRRDLYVGRSTPGADGAVLRGRVHATDGRPLPGASVRIANEAQAVRTNDQGAFELRSPPFGTRNVEIRLLGYTPETRAADLRAGQTSSLDVKMLTVKQVMDTVRVTGARVFDRDRNGFAARRRAATGYYFDASDVERLRPLGISELIRRTPSVSIEEAALDRVITMRDTFGNGRCSPAIFIDGQKVTDLDVRDIDTWVPPEHLDGLEVYTSAERAPMQFTTLEGCGVIVIWSRLPPTKKDKIVVRPPPSPDR